MGEMISTYWYHAPAVTRCLTVLPIGCHLAGYVFGPFLEFAMELSLAKAVQGHVWTIFTAVFWEPPGSLLNTLITFLLTFWVLSSVPMLERASGSGRLLVLTLSASVAINVCFLVLAVLLHAAWGLLGWMSVWPFVTCHGLMPLFVCGITVKCLAAPDAETSFFGFPMKSKYYPAVLVSVFALMAGHSVLREVAALLVGYLYDCIPWFRALQPQDGMIVRWESQGVCMFGKSFFGGQWIKLSDSLGTGGPGGTGGGLLPTRPGYSIIGRPSGAGPGQGPGGVGGAAAAGPTNFVIFAGRGNRLGDN